jgi:hypothetical protein
MDNEEPIEMAHYPAGHAPEENEVPAIERDDFPAPPYPYAIEGFLPSLCFVATGSHRGSKAIVHIVGGKR